MLLPHEVVTTFLETGETERMIGQTVPNLNASGCWIFLWHLIEIIRSLNSIFDNPRICWRFGKPKGTLDGFRTILCYQNLSLEKSLMFEHERIMVWPSSLPGWSVWPTTRYSCEDIRWWGWGPAILISFFFEVCSVLGTCFDGKSNNVGSLVLGKQKLEVITLQFPLCPSSNTFDNRVLQPSCKQISTAYIATPASSNRCMAAMPCPAWNSYLRFTVINSNYSKSDARTKCLETLAWSMNCLCALVRHMCIYP